MRAICISESYCQYKTDTGYCGYTGMGCAQSLVRSVKYDPKVSLVHQVELTDDCIGKIAEAVAKKLKHGRGESVQYGCEYWDSESNFCSLYRPSAERHGRWIPVTERLPEKRGMYLVSGKWANKDSEVWVCEFMRLNYFCGWCNSAERPVVQVWMPLPEPYKGCGVKMDEVEE